MTNYTVVWVRDAVDEVANIWMAAADRRAVAAASNEIEHLLSSNPFGSGEELAEGLRVLSLPPLRVIYAVVEDDPLVQVLKVKVS